MQDSVAKVSERQSTCVATKLGGSSFVQAELSGGRTYQQPIVLRRSIRTQYSNSACPRLDLFTVLGPTWVASTGTINRFHELCDHHESGHRSCGWMAWQPKPEPRPGLLRMPRVRKRNSGNPNPLEPLWVVPVLQQMFPLSSKMRHNNRQAVADSSANDALRTHFEMKSPTQSPPASPLQMS